MTHLNEIPDVSVDEQLVNRNTLTQFFAVKSKGQQYIIGRNNWKNEDDIALEKALRQSLKECRSNRQVWSRASSDSPAALLFSFC